MIEKMARRTGKQGLHERIVEKDGRKLSAKELRELLDFIPASEDDRDEQLQRNLDALVNGWDKLY